MAAQPLLEELVGDILAERQLTVAAAESCTGGLILHRLTNVSGSSAYVIGGFVTYSNAAKVKFVGVKPETLEAHGAVSAETAVEMARGARLAFATSLALSVTGIAGPGGATPGKPVGLVYVGLSSAHGEQVREFRWSGDRIENKALSAEAALRMLYDYLVGTV